LISGVWSQENVIVLKNPSFEEIPRKGVNIFLPINGWDDCGLIYYREETPPDIHPHNFWGVTKSASHGKTYLGMVVRDNDTRESVSQKMSKPIMPEVCYKFSIDLAQSEKYISATRMDSRTVVNFSTPIILRIWGGNKKCKEDELLAKSTPVANKEWQAYHFTFRPSKEYKFISLEAFYETPEHIPYNGHILVDNASSIVEIPCDPEEKE
jgi:hypothetical protein